MKCLSGKITDYVIKSGVISEESYAVYQYGFQIGLEMVSCFLICFFIALYLHKILQFLISLSIFALLRTYAGGVHLNSFFRCFICSTAVQTTILLINTHYIVVPPIAWGILLISSALILKNAPVESVNKELDVDEKKHCKSVVLKVVVVVLFFSVCCTVVRQDKIVFLISLTVLSVLISQYLGMIKYNIEKGRKNKK